MERAEKVFCWTCGAANGSHTPDCDFSALLSVKSPADPLPFCGKEDIIQDEGVRERNCCECGQGWMCDSLTHLAGTCPNCGASGPNSGLTEIEPKEEFKIPEEKYLPKKEISFTPPKEEFSKKFQEKFPTKIYDRIPEIENNLLMHRTPIPTLIKLSPEHPL